MNGYVVVIGAANIDIGGAPINPLIPADSNPGNISITYGGVARNIANNLSRLDVPVKLITAVGGDTLGRDLLLHCEKNGIDTSHVLVDPNDTSSMYLYINNDVGDMELAIDHIKIGDKITPEYLDSVEPVINGAALVVADGNISREAFIHLKKICRVPIYEDPVSTALAVRIRDQLDGVDTMKPNRLEAEYLTGMTIRTEADYRAAAEAILAMGVGRVFISMGEEGMLAADHDDMYIIGECPAEVVCTTGAGDSATAAIAWATLAVRDLAGTAEAPQSALIFAAKAANAVASLTIGSKETISPALSPAAVLDRIARHNMTVKKI
ncbi:MAG: bifunctional hydroxymethylpyrimidine kinase/phosphomethylpyrimidine kinase [Mogibacterium sp.]|nr:bifunctional hydroxymethylpyrimidine kinase/phosphomethylpyrimidine kinase [Mogibacterium sp.]